MEDKFEGAYTLRDMRRLQHLESLSQRARGAPPELVELYLRERLNKIRARAYVSCWYSGPDESAALWQRSVRDTDFVAIQTTFGDLAKSIKRSLFAGYVRYINYERARIPSGSVLSPFFCKRRIFSHEKEFRLLLYDREQATPPLGHVVSIAPSTVVRAVMLAPYTPTWAREAVEALLRRYKIQCPVLSSGVDAEPP